LLSFTFNEFDLMNWRGCWNTYRADSNPKTLI